MTLKIHTVTRMLYKHSNEHTLAPSVEVLRGLPWGCSGGVLASGGSRGLYGATSEPTWHFAIWGPTVHTTQVQRHGRAGSQAAPRPEARERAAPAAS